MPFRSQAQRRLFYAKSRRGEMPMSRVREWERETRGRRLPEKVAVWSPTDVQRLRTLDPKLYPNLARVTTADEARSLAPAAMTGHERKAVMEKQLRMGIDTPSGDVAREHAALLRSNPALSAQTSSAKIAGVVSGMRKVAGVYGKGLAAGTLIGVPYMVGRDVKKRQRQRQAEAEEYRG